MFLNRIVRAIRPSSSPAPEAATQLKNLQTYLLQARQCFAHEGASSNLNCQIETAINAVDAALQQRPHHD